MALTVRSVVRLAERKSDGERPQQLRLLRQREVILPERLRALVAPAGGGWCARREVVCDCPGPHCMLHGAGTKGARRLAGQIKGSLYYSPHVFLSQGRRPPR